MLERLQAKGVADPDEMIHRSRRQAQPKMQIDLLTRFLPCPGTCPTHPENRTSGQKKGLVNIRHIEDRISPVALSIAAGKEDVDVVVLAGKPGVEPGTLHIRQHQSRISVAERTSSTEAFWAGLRLRMPEFIGGREVVGKKRMAAVLTPLRFQATSREPNIGRFSVLLTGFRGVCEVIPASFDRPILGTIRRGMAGPTLKRRKQKNGSGLPDRYPISNLGERSPASGHRPLRTAGKGFNFPTR